MAGFSALPGVPCWALAGAGAAMHRPSPKAMTEVCNGVFIRGLPTMIRASALETGTRRVVAAVDLRVAVLAGASDDAWALASAEQRAGSRLSVAVERAVVAHSEVVALLAEIRPRRDEQLVVVGPMRLMTAEATLTDRRVFPEERPAFFGMAGVADVVDRIGVQEGTRRRAMRVVTVHAGHLSLGQRHVRTPAELGALLRVALRAGLRDALAGQETVGRQLLHRIVAIGAAEVASRVH